MTSSEQANPWSAFAGRSVIAPSLLACDFYCMAGQVEQALAAGVEVLHVDIMDGHFVPNLSMGPAVVKAIRKHQAVPMDVHLMVSDPGFFFEPFAKAGASSLTFHIEADERPGRLVDRLRELKMGVGVCVRPRTAAEALAGIIADVDLVLVMTVEPGYGGQAFMPDMLDKIAAIRKMLRPEQRLEVDGGINPQTGRQCAQHGADTFVSGTDIFGASEIARAVRELREAVERG